MPIYGQFLPLAPNGDKRQDVRRKLSLLARGMKHDGTGIAVQIHNISGTGLLFESDIDLQACDRIEIELPHAGGITAVVIWASGRLFGCQFEGPVSPATLSAVELKSAVAPMLESSTSAVASTSGAEGAGAELAPDEFPDDVAPAPLQEVIGRSREQIARAAGLSIDRVRIIVEY
ncbi:PilZ domain-containing protein [Sphingopyxis kveilinensis]|uniref:PilZ domain-containing protein n=1 Tax=Sphingopyxis kveilinensis TaxID=3114367 RepID=UPI0030CA847B